MSEKFSLKYELLEHGWAIARITNGNVSVDMSASYLHDSLRELANAANSISCGPATSRVVFMDEPGEHQLSLVRGEGSDCHFSLKWFNDWDSLGIRTLPGSMQVCEGTVSVRRFVQHVYTALWSLFERYGETGYKERWCEHDFPYSEMQRLVGNHST